MNAGTRKTFHALLGGKAPRDLSWDKVIDLFEDIADEVHRETSDRVAVTMGGHRTVFHRRHDGRLSLDDIEQARHFIRTADAPGMPVHLLVVAIDDERARLVTFDLDQAATVSTEHDLTDSDDRSRHLRTVERHTGRDDAQEENAFFDTVAADIRASGHLDFVILGHGTGKANAAAGLLDRIRAHHHDILERFAGVGDIDLSAATLTDLEDAARAVLDNGF
ncbi:hypothetical protein [Frondihabitans australicus]|uniref:Uncharacterized protein n=1 Tax=Frondihabitans australicus TaxID=386892 RepID=A0A495IKV3_9MICO|nr:hypothetical protein [Frondihabitans australicus]RKR76360.1 hypothetical protein C8E83_3530 [Frondihabitans australicus]